MLVNYRLNTGLCESLGQYLQSSVRRLNQDFMLQRLVLDNNNLKDAELAAILNGLKPQKTLRSLVYANNEMGGKSVAQL